MNPYLSTILANVASASSAATIVIITLVVLCALGLAAGIALHLRKQKEQMARIAAQLAEQEAARKALQEEQERMLREAAAAAAEAREIQSVEEANTYQIGQFVCSTDMGSQIQQLTRPVRVVPGEEQTPQRKYNLVIHGSDAGKPLYYALTKPVNSVGRATTSKKGNADICIATADKYISRVHAVLTYKPEESRDGVIDPAFWMLAINQGSEKNPGAENVRKAVVVTETGQQIPDIAFMIDGKQKVFLNNNIYLTIE